MNKLTDVIDVHCKESPGSVDFIDAFAWRVVGLYVDFKITIFFSVKYLERGTRQNYTF